MHIGLISTNVPLSHTTEAKAKARERMPVLAREEVLLQPLTWVRVIL